MEYRKYKKVITVKNITSGEEIQISGYYQSQKDRDIMFADFEKKMLEKFYLAHSEDLWSQVKRLIRIPKWDGIERRKWTFTNYEVTIKYEVGVSKQVNDPIRPIKKVLRPIDEFNGMTPQESLDYIKSQIDVFECDDERLSDAIKRLQLLIEEAK